MTKPGINELFPQVTANHTALGLIGLDVNNSIFTDFQGGLIYNISFLEILVLLPFFVQNVQKMKEKVDEYMQK